MSFAGKIRSYLWRATMQGQAKGAHITRYSMYANLERVGKSLARREGDVLAISHSQNLCEILNIKPKSLVEANYPEQNILALPQADESFDFVVSDQVLEHIEGDPQRAFDESWRVLRPGGLVVHTTCFINPIHASPNDYWRFTPEALKYLGRRFSRVIDCGGWGNFEAWQFIRDGLRFYPIPHAKWHPAHRLATRNDPLWPISTWIVAQK